MTEYYLKIDNKEALEWLQRLIINTLENKSHPTTISYYNQLRVWEDAFNNILSLDDIQPPPAPLTPKEPVSSGRIKRNKNREKKKELEDPYSCTVHPKYGGKRRPRTDCEKCWSVFKSLHPMEYSVCRRDFERKFAKSQEG